MDTRIMSADEAIAKLVSRSQSVPVPDGLKDKLEELFAELRINSRSEDTFWQNYQGISKYVEWVVSLPWQNSSQDILDLDYSKKKLNEGHFGLDMVKERILEYVSVLAAENRKKLDRRLNYPW